MTPPPDNPTPQRMGRGMMWMSAMIALAALTWFFDGALENKRNPNRNLKDYSTDGKREVRLQRNSMGHYLALGKINGVDVEFLLDTGATTIVIPESLAQSIGLSFGSPYSVSTANGMATAYATRLDSVELGSIVLSDLRAGISNGLVGGEVLLGMNFLKQLDMTQSGDTLTLNQYD